MSDERYGLWFCLGAAPPLEQADRPVLKDERVCLAATATEPIGWGEPDPGRHNFLYEEFLVDTALNPHVDPFLWQWRVSGRWISGLMDALTSTQDAEAKLEHGTGFEVCAALAPFLLQYDGCLVYAWPDIYDEEPS